MSLSTPTVGIAADLQREVDRLAVAYLGAACTADDDIARARSGAPPSTSAR